MEEKKRIRFIDSHYHTLFSIADGDSIEIVYPDGKREERVCTYIDEYHTQVGVVLCQEKVQIKYNQFSLFM